MPARAIATIPPDADQNSACAQPLAEPPVQWNENLGAQQLGSGYDTKSFNLDFYVICSMQVVRERERE